MRVMRLEAVGAEAVDADGDAVEPGFLQRAGEVLQQHAVGREREVFDRRRSARSMRTRSTMPWRTVGSPPVSLKRRMPWTSIAARTTSRDLLEGEDVVLAAASGRRLRACSRRSGSCSGR